MAKRTPLGRRQFLYLSAMATGSAALASCAPTPPASPTAAPAVAPTKAPAAPAPTTAPAAAAPTKAPAAPAPATTAAPTQAPAAPAATSAPAAAATKAPAAAKPEEQKIGKSLIGKLEGPEVITDPARIPKSFKEAPALADLVKAGKLPPVQERIGQDPLVLKPVYEIGKYGGTIRRGFTGPADRLSGARFAGGLDFILQCDFTGVKLGPNIAKAWEVGDGGKTTTVSLRRGMKWSDGKPFTADDFVFWWEDVYGSKDLNPAPSTFLQINNQSGTMEKVDTYTVRWRFPEPYYVFPDMLGGPTTISGSAFNGLNALGSYAPAHYLKQYLPKYASKEELDKQIKDAKFDSWVSLFKFKNSWHLNPDLPVLTPWVTTSPANKPQWILERNPYSIWVDTEGNQLPYVDRVLLNLGENIEIVNLRAIAGEFDFQERHMDIGKTPIFLENQSKGGYQLRLDPTDYCEFLIKFNTSYEADPEIRKWFDSRDFRRALSLGIEREQINETFWLGTGTPTSVVPADHTRYFPGPEYRTRWSTYDPKQANELLDKAGLDKKDAEGFRLRSDGKGRLRIEVMTVAASFLQWTQMMEMIKEQYKKIGIDLTVQELERSLADKRCDANESQLRAWAGEGDESLYVRPNQAFPVSAAQAEGHGPLHGLWFASGGKQGKEPPPYMRDVMEKWKKGLGVPEEEQIRLGKEVWKILAEELSVIGVVGLGPAFNGVRVVNNKLGNAPARIYNGATVWGPSGTRPVTLFWKA